MSKFADKPPRPVGLNPAHGMGYGDEKRGSIPEYTRGWDDRLREIKPQAEGGISTLAELLRQARIGHGLTYQEVADLCGTSKSYIHALESGKSEPGLDIAARLSRALHLSARSMFDAVFPLKGPK